MEGEKPLSLTPQVNIDDPGDSLLKPLSSLDSKIVGKRMLKLLAVQVVEVNGVARFQYKFNLCRPAHCLYTWILEQCRQMTDVADTNDEKEIIMTEAVRVLGVIKSLEKKLKEDELSVLTPSLGDFLKQIVMNSAPKKLNDQSTNTKREHECDSRGKITRNDSGPSFKGDPDVEKFLPVIRMLVKHPQDEDHCLSTWEDIIGYRSVKEERQDEYIIPRMKTHSVDGKGRATVNGKAKTCLMLFGPPGTGKTKFAEGLATKLNYNFMCINQSNFASSMVGENLHKLSAIFMVAVESAPSILFFDEMEGMFPTRVNLRSEHKKEEITLFIVKMNELEKYNMMHPDRQVLVFGATNIPSMVDEAPWRRLQKYIHVGLPADDDKRLMIEHLVGKQQCSMLSDRDWKTVLIHTTGFTCQDVGIMCTNIEQLPEKLVRKATHFRPLRSLIPIPGKKNSAEKVQNTVTHWTPCTPDQPEAKKMSHLDIPSEEICLPSLDVRHIVEVSKACPGTLNIYDPDGPVQICLRFAEQGAQKFFDASEDLGKAFDSEEAYDDAKKLKEQWERNASILETEKRTTQHRKVHQVEMAIQGGVLVEVNKTSKMSSPLPPIPAESAIQGKKKNGRKSIFGQFLKVANFLD